MYNTQIAMLTLILINQDKLALTVKPCGSHFFKANLKFVVFLVFAMVCSPGP